MTPLLSKAIRSNKRTTQLNGNLQKMLNIQSGVNDHQICLGRRSKSQSFQNVPTHTTHLHRRSRRLTFSKALHSNAEDSVTQHNNRTDKSYQRQCLEQIGQTFGLKQLDNLYKVSAQQENTLLNNNNNWSLSTSLKELYPELNWNPLQCSKLPASHWKDSKNQRRYLEAIGKVLGVKELDDWYKISAEQAKSLKPSLLNNYYKGSLIKALQTIYPEHNWNPERFYKTQHAYWKDKENQRAHLEKVGRKLGVRELNDWYKISGKQILRQGKAVYFLEYYNGSLYATLTALYPHHNWDPLKFNKAPQSYWKNLDNQRHCLETIGRELGVTQLNDWYKISAMQVLAKRPAVLKDYYKSSLIVALKVLYPEHDWNPILFQKVSNGFWNKPTTKRLAKSVMIKMISEYNIQSIADWYTLPFEQHRMYKKIAQNLFGGNKKMLSKWFPKEKWAADLNSSTLERKLRSMLEIISPAEPHVTINGYSVDIYLPQFSLAFEFQGKQHYVPHKRGSLKQQAERDQRKRAVIDQLIEIPFWWNGSWSQVLSTMKTKQMDCLGVARFLENTLY